MSLLRGVLLTALFYLPLPLLFSLLRKKPIYKKSITWICAGFGALVFIGFAAYYILQGIYSTPNLVAAIVWTGLGRVLCLEIIEDRHLLADAQLDPGSMDTGTASTESESLSSTAPEQEAEQAASTDTRTTAPAVEHSRIRRRTHGKHTAPSRGAPVWIVIILVLVIGVLAGLLLYPALNPTAHDTEPSVSKPVQNTASAATASPAPTPSPTREPVKASNGTVFIHPKDPIQAPFSVAAPHDQDCYVYLHNPFRPENDISVYVLADDSTEFYVPVGSYELYYAIGLDWFGIDAEDNMVFGADTTWFKADETFVFHKEDGAFVGYTISLYKSVWGNFDSNEISNTALPF